MEREWIEQSKKLIDLLALKLKPVAITFTNEKVKVENPKRTWVCRALKLAAEGQSFVIDAETSACGGGHGTAASSSHRPGRAEGPCRRFSPVEKN